MALNDELMNDVFRYLSGEMSEEESKAFEQKIEVNAELKEEIRMLQEVDDVLFEEEWKATTFDPENKKAKQYFDHFNQEKNKAFYEELKNIQVEEKGSQQSSGKGMMHWLARAAVIALVGVFGYTLMINNPSTDKLYSKYAQYDNLTGMAQKSGEGSELATAENYFKQGDFESAQPIFQDYLNSGATESIDIIKIYNALSNAELGKFPEALSSLNALGLDENSLYQEQAQFYEALVTLKSGEKEAAKELLKTISETDSNFSEKANRLLKKLK